jgi:hypothetical protein
LSDTSTVHNFESDVEIRVPEELEVSTTKRRKILPEPEVEQDVEMEDVSEDVGDFKTIAGRPITLQGMVLVAKPAPFRPLVNYGPASAVPASSGIVFPYFHGMITPDFQFLPNFMWRFFLQSFGETRDAFTKGFKKWTDGSKSWCDSFLGLQLQHIFFGVQLALETQARVFIVSELETYQGFVLLGEGFSVVAHDKVYTPVSSEELRIHLSSMSIHNNALEKICDLLSASTLAGSKKRKRVVPGDISSNRSLYVEFHQRSIDDDTEEKILSLANDLSFPERYWRVNPTTIAKLFESYGKRDGGHPESEPMYIGSGLLNSVDAAYLALSVFGPTAPSFYTVKGEKKDIPAPGRPDPLSVLDAATGKPILPVVPYTMKSIRTAMADLYKVYMDRAIYVLPRERAGPSRTTQFVGKARDEIWTSLRKHVGDRGEEDRDRKKPRTDPVAEEKGNAGGLALEYGNELEFE